MTVAASGKLFEDWMVETTALSAANKLEKITLPGLIFIVTASVCLATQFCRTQSQIG